MSKKDDQPNKFKEAPFEYSVTKDHKIRIKWFGKQVVILTGNASLKLQKRLAEANNEQEKQLLLAKATGNFKRGNER